MFNFLLDEIRNSRFFAYMKMRNEKILCLPPVALNELSNNVKDFLIASSVAGKSVPDVICEALVKKASASGFLSKSPEQTI